MSGASGTGRMFQPTRSIRYQFHGYYIAITKYIYIYLYIYDIYICIIYILFGSFWGFGRQICLYWAVFMIVIQYEVTWMVNFPTCGKKHTHFPTKADCFIMGHLTEMMVQWVSIRYFHMSQLPSMAISGSDSLEVPTIYKAYFSGLNFREYPHKIWPEIWY